jgi:hypothetical protein
VTQEQVHKGKLALQPYEDRSVGYPLDPDLSAMTEEERETRRATFGRLNELVRKAEEGDRESVPEIREILRESPELAWRLMDYGKMAEWHFIQRMTRDEDLVSKEILECQLAAMREEIVGENPSTIERLLAERIVLTWLQIQLFEGLYAANMQKKSTSIKEDNYHQKRLDQAHRHHLSAIRMLAQVRKLGPAIQINIAGKQINQAG